MVAGVALVFASVSTGCGGSRGEAQDPVLQATQRLQGSWRVQTFTPETPLEAPLQGLLNAQLGSLTVTFQGNEFVANGPGVNVNGRIQLTSAAGELLSGTLVDATGVGYRVSGQFSGATLQFRTYDAPWRGTGTLQR